MDGIMNNITQKLRIQWTQQMSQLFYKTLNDIFTNSVTDYKKLISTEDEDSKELDFDTTSKETRRSIKQFTELNSKELSDVIEYIINDMNNKNQFDMNNKKANLYYHKENIINYIQSQNWTGLFDFKTKIFRQELHKALQQSVTTLALDKLRKAIISFIHTFDINKFNNITIRNEIIVPATSVNLKKQKQNELLDKINNKRFFEIVEQAIPMANEQISLTKINQQEVITFFKGKEGINKDIFKQLNKKTFCDKVHKCIMSRGSGAKLFKQIKDLIKERTLTDLHDDEFYFIVKQGINDINEENNKKGSGFKLINCEEIIKYFKQIGLNGGQFIESFNKKIFQNRIQDRLSKGTTNKLYKYLTQTCDIEKTLSLMCDIEKGKKTEKIIINIDISGSCKQISKLEDCNMMQLRYALLFVMIEFNKHKDKEKQKQISNIDDVIEFLCYKYYKQQLDAPKIAKMNLSEFAYLLHDILKVRHNPGKKILIGLRDYNFDDMPTQNIDLNLPFVLIQSIREQQEKMDGKSNKLNENNILYAMQYMKYSQVEDRKKFVDFLKNECYIARGPSIKLRNCIIRNVENINKNQLCLSISLNKYINQIKPLIYSNNIFNIIKKYNHITECNVNDLRSIIECCVEFINRETVTINNFDEIWNVLNDKINKPNIIINQKQIKSLKECDNKLFVKIIEECIDKLINNGKFKTDSDNSLGFNANKIKLLNYFKSSDITGSNFNKMFPKKARFAKNISDICFTKKQKGIKTELMKIYIEITEYDYTKLSIPIVVKNNENKNDNNDDSKQKEMNGKIFVNNFKSKEAFIEYMRRNTSIQNKNVLIHLYEFIINGFFKWNKSHNNNHFMNWLYLFAVKKYEIKMFVKNNYNNNNNDYCSADEELKKLNGVKLINDPHFRCDMFVNILHKSKIFNIQNSEIAMNIYNDLMEYNLRLKQIKQICKCNHNELVYILRKCVLPQFNKNKKSNFTLNIHTIIESLNKNTDLKGKDFRKENRKLIADTLYNKNLKLGPLRKLSSNIDQYSIMF
eukprot:485916_1